MTPRIFAGALVVIVCALEATGQTVTDPNWSVQSLGLSGLSQPTAIRFLGSNPGQFFVIEKATGIVKYFSGGTTGSTAFDFPVSSNSERGLLGIAVQPNFDPTGVDTTRNKVYLYYSRSSTGSDSTTGSWLDNRLVRLDWNGTALSGETLIATLGSSTGQGGQATGPNHDGGPITFGPDGKLYGIVGDLNRAGLEQNNPSASTSFVGAIYRLNPDGSIPSDNPFVDNANPAVHGWYAYGIRNSFGLTFDLATNKLWDTENGPASYDEINLVNPGFNSGWTDIMGPLSRDTGTNTLANLSSSGSTYSDPEFSWLSTVAPTGMHFIGGSNLGMIHDNEVLVADNNNGFLYKIPLNATRTGFDFSSFPANTIQDLVADSSTERDLLKIGSGFSVPVDIQRGPDGNVYVLSLGGGQVYRLTSSLALRPGDFDDNGVVDDRDIDILWRIVRDTGGDPGAPDSGNLNGDSFVNEDDVDYLLANLLTAGPNRAYGDANLSGGVPDITDYNLWRTGTGGWAAGDFDGSGGVPELNDYNLWRTGPTQFPGSVGSHGDGEGGGLVPEPAAIVLMGLALPALAAAVRRRTKCRRTTLAAHYGSLLIGLTLIAPAWGQLLPTNNDPSNQIRFNTPAEADAKRMQLIDFIWDGALPTSIPTVTADVPLPDQAVDINPQNVARVDRLDTDVSGWDFHSISYVMHPTNTANADRVVIVHQGHTTDLSYGVGTTANYLLQQGFTVVATMMPLYGWNIDGTASVPGQGTLTYNSHDEMILNTGPAYGGAGFRLFLEPVVQSINYFEATNQSLQDISMVGLSGGGWATSMMSAIDERIKLSVPVAGSAPLYQRNLDPASVGDAEQHYIPLYDENIQPDGSGGGVATWLEIYALGGYGNGRRQIQVTNEFDPCCLSGTFPDTYKSIVSSKVAELGGQWEHVLDSTHASHQISNYVISLMNDAVFVDADFDGDGDRDAADIDILWRMVRGTGADPGGDDSGDLNKDGFVNEDDVDTMLASMMSAGTNRAYGDTDLAGGAPDLADYDLWHAGTGGWAAGDFDGSGGVPELTDYNLWRTGPTQFPGSVGSHGSGAPGGGGFIPEPATLVLMGLALPTFLLAARGRIPRGDS